MRNVRATLNMQAYRLDSLKPCSPQKTHCLIVSHVKRDA